MFRYYYIGLKLFSNEIRLIGYTLLYILKVKEQLWVLLYAVIICDQICDEKVLSLQFSYENLMTAADMCQLCEIIGSAFAVCPCKTRLTRMMFYSTFFYDCMRIAKFYKIRANCAVMKNI